MKDINAFGPAMSLLVSMWRTSSLVERWNYRQPLSDFFGDPVHNGMLNSRGVCCWFLLKLCTIIIPQLDHNPGISLHIAYRNGTKQQQEPL